MELDIEDFQKLDIKVGKVIAAEKVERSENLLKLEVDFGEDGRRCIAGIQNYYSPDELIGNEFIFVTNLKPRKLMGLESQCMILAAEDDKGNVVLIKPEKDVKVGSQIR